MCDIKHVGHHTSNIPQVCKIMNVPHCLYHMPCLQCTLETMCKSNNVWYISYAMRVIFCGHDQPWYLKTLFTLSTMWVSYDVNETLAILSTAIMRHVDVFSYIMCAGNGICMVLPVVNSFCRINHACATPQADGMIICYN